MSTVSVSPFSQHCVDFINEHINKELTASYAYYMLSVYFNRHNVAFHNVANYFKKASEEEREHADKFIDEQVKEEDKYMRLITILKRMGSGLGEQLFDKDIISTF